MKDESRQPTSSSDFIHPSSFILFLGGTTMPYSVSTRTAAGVTGLDPTLVVLDDGQGSVAEVWPALGFNCIRWQAVRDGQSLDLLNADPGLINNGRPTRSGIPVLFPFP